MMAWSSLIYRMLLWFLVHGLRNPLFSDLRSWWHDAVWSTGYRFGSLFMVRGTHYFPTWDHDGMKQSDLQDVALVPCSWSEEPIIFRHEIMMAWSSLINRISLWFLVHGPRNPLCFNMRSRWHKAGWSRGCHFNSSFMGRGTHYVPTRDHGVWSRLNKTMSLWFLGRSGFSPSPSSSCGCWSATSSCRRGCATSYCSPASSSAWPPSSTCWWWRPSATPPSATLSCTAASCSPSRSWCAGSSLPCGSPARPARASPAWQWRRTPAAAATTATSEAPSSWPPWCWAWSCPSLPSPPSTCGCWWRCAWAASSARRWGGRQPRLKLAPTAAATTAPQGSWARPAPWWWSSAASSSWPGRHSWRWWSSTPCAPPAPCVRPLTSSCSSPSATPPATLWSTPTATARSVRLTSRSWQAAASRLPRPCLFWCERVPCSSPSAVTFPLWQPMADVLGGWVFPSVWKGFFRCLQWLVCHIPVCACGWVGFTVHNDWLAGQRLSRSLSLVGAATSIIFVSRWKFCCNKHVFCHDKICLSQQKYKHIFVMTKLLSWRIFVTKLLLQQAYFCRNKHVFVLSQQKWYLWQLPLMIVL